MGKGMRRSSRFRIGLAVVVLVVIWLVRGWHGWEDGVVDDAASEMNFVNEHISAEDFERNKLRELWSRHNRPDGLDPFAGGLQQWTVDKESGTFLVFVKGGDREDPGLLKFVMRWQSQDYVAMMRIGPGGSKVFSKVPFVRYWELQEFSGPGNKKVALDILRAAMTAYGVVGLIHQFDELELHFNF